MVERKAQRAEALFQRVCGLPAAEREQILDETCAEDTDLRRDVESLLGHLDAAGTSFLHSPVQFTELGQARQPGDRLGHYEIQDTIGEGGMGVVYRAFDPRLERTVAVKVLHPGADLVPSSVQRFLREARAASALNHPNICTVYDIGELEGRPFLVLECLEGETLRARLDRGPLGLESMLDFAQQIVAGLDTAHRAGIVHRDLKPANVYITSLGLAKILDFGLAKLTAPDGRLDPLTQSGIVAGTPNYMSPEQALGRDLDARTDLFSLGVVLYEMATGVVPFEVSTVAAYYDALLNRPPRPVADIDASIPEPLVRLIDRCLEKDPDRRHARAADVLGDLAALGRSVGRETGDLPGSVWLRSSPGQGDTSDFDFREAEIAQQDIRFCNTDDGVRIAYSSVGTGPLIVRVLGHFTHLEKEWEWPDLRRFWQRLAEHYTVVRYDGRGIGLSDRFAGEFTETTRQRDLDAVLSAIGTEEVTLLGISEGGWTATRYANDHPQRVSHLVLYGAYCHGARARPGYDAEEEEALHTLIRKGWGRDTPQFRQLFTSVFFRDDADPALIAHFNELQRLSADPETAARYHESCHARGDGRDLFSKVKTPTLVVHCRDDIAVSSEEGRLLASIIPRARLVLLPSGAHYFPTDQTVVRDVVRAIRRFLPEPGSS